jgi:hypothetical protein
MTCRGSEAAALSNTPRKARQRVILNREEMEQLFKQDEAQRDGGGWQRQICCDECGGGPKEWIKDSGARLSV